jgi:hypothetical protein
MRRIPFVAAVAALLLALPTLHGHDQSKDDKPEPKKVSELMRKKLENAQKVLEGITLNDFKMIERHADELIQISKAVEWRVIKTPQYEIHSNEFRRVADSLAQAGKDKNTDGAALAYVELTLTCVKCHKYVREVRWASAEE